MARAIQVATLVLLATLTFGVAFGIYEAWVYVPQIGSRAITALDGINGALTTVNRPKSGTLAQIDGATEDLRLVLVPIGKVAIHEQHQLDTIDNLVQRTGSDLHLALGSLTDAGMAATGALHQSSTDLATFNGAISSAQARIEAVAVTQSQVDASIKEITDDMTTNSKELGAVAVNTANVTSDIAKVTDHFEKIIDAPKKRTFWGTVKQGWQILWQISMLAK